MAREFGRLMTTRSSLVVIAHFDVVGIAVDEAETDAPLVVHGDRMLALPVAAQRMEAIAWRHLQVVERCGEVHILEFAGRPSGHIRRKALGRAENVQFLRALIRERLDHPSSVRCHVTRVKHGPARFA